MKKLQRTEGKGNADVNFVISDADMDTVFKSKMKTAKSGSEDRNRKTKKRGKARRIRLSGEMKTIIRDSMLCTKLGEHTGNFYAKRMVAWLSW